MTFLEADGTPALLDIESVDHEGRGVGRVAGKVLFVEGGITGERVAYRVFQTRSRHEFAAATHIRRESVLRVKPKCPYFERCGGCSMQHIGERAQVAIKQRILEDNLKRLGGVVPEEILPPIHGPAWSYRARARLSVRFVKKRDEVLIGFNDRKSHHVVDMHSCAILPAHVSMALTPLRVLLARFESRAVIPQVEISVGDDATVLLIRNLEPLSAEECYLLEQFGSERNIGIYLQPNGPKSIHPLGTQPKQLSYFLGEFGVSIKFGPQDFTQINYAVNGVLIRRALSLLDPQEQDRIADLFCGLGNFSLPLARRGAWVTGVEGDHGMVEKARENAQANALDKKVRFHVANLAEMTPEAWATLGTFDKLLIDPPRLGAAAVVETIPQEQIRRIVYVSCNPATLARDAGTLVRDKGYRLAAAGVVNMFPHTAHVESMALFEREPE
ncbi:MAG: 23S rRNA (uracil(1939)-C(5))-methyltransferase RlmD [Betaproteobacteria bacterium]|nr:23S rRNA (uracil(1939)-C(5))-methyltransferase RlmD [Betaproteobacteria bacterium]